MSILEKLCNRVLGSAKTQDERDLASKAMAEYIALRNSNRAMNQLVDEVKSCCGTYDIVASTEEGVLVEIDTTLLTKLLEF